MSNRESYGRRSACRALLVPVLAAAAILTSVGGAVADTPEYWSRETFSAERPTVTAALTNYDDDAPQPARRRAQHVSAVEGDDVRPARQSQRAQAKAKPKPKPVRVASLGNTYALPAKPERSISGGGGVRWVASAGCLNGSLRGVIAQVAARFGSVTVNSTCRSRRHNARVGGASRSMHLTGDAADFRIHGNWGAAAGFIRSLVGGFKHYGGGLFHIDTGVKRTW